MRIRLEFSPRDVWLGLRWLHKAEPAGYGTVRTGGTMTRLDVWVCLLPCLPVRLTWLRGYPDAGGVRKTCTPITWLDREGPPAR